MFGGRECFHSIPFGNMSRGLAENSFLSCQARAEYKGLRVLWLTLIFTSLSTIFLVGTQEGQTRTLKDIQGKAFDFDKLKGSYSLLLFVDPNILNQKNILYYAQVLKTKYANMGLKIVGVLADGDLQDHQANALGRLSFPIIVDHGNKIFAQYGIKSCCGGTVFAMPSNEIIFHDSALLSEEDLRKITEKNILGKITTPSFPVPASSFVNMEFLDRLQVLKLSTNQFGPLAGIAKPKMILTFFSRACSTCGFRVRLKTLSRLAALIANGDERTEIGLVFPDYVDETDIMGMVESDISSFSIFLSPNLFPLDYQYLADLSMKTDPFSIIIDSSNRLLFIERIKMTEEAVEAEMKSFLSKSANE